MSGVPLYVFVEGKENDPIFYGSLCRAIFSVPGFYKIANASQIPNSSSGKEALIKFFEYLKSVKGLITNLKGKKTAIIFFMDKDLDGILGKKIKSNHVVYTRYYEVENHIIRHGNISIGCAHATSADPPEIEIALGDPEEFLRDAAQEWKDWVKICIFSRELSLKGIRSYSSPSPINDDLTGKVDTATYEKILQDIESKSGLQHEKFVEEFAKVSEMVDDLYSNGKQDEVFKGKWYVYFIVRRLRELSNRVPADLCSMDLRSVDLRVIGHIRQTLDFCQPWTKHFTRKLRRVAALLAWDGSMRTPINE